MKTPDRLDVLVCGAGPDRPRARAVARALGVRVRRIIDAAAEPGTTSRALAVHARTLEFYRQLGLADAVVARGLPFAAVNLWVRGRHVGARRAGRHRRGAEPVSRSSSSSRRTSTSAS